ncbi:MAG: glycosyltransferase family 2 protein [Sphingobacteriales bacterium]|nr:glycosyltransferase family 2 protein [Sphingobacteriales bacterium]
MPPLSAVIITHNEAHNITRCLDSLQGIADEVIIIDSFSTDTTTTICQQYGAKVIQRKWEGYTAAKNYGNHIARHDYILSLDADETLSDELKQSILSAKQNFSKDAYCFNRCTNYCGTWIRHSAWYPDTKLRLWNKQKGTWQGNIHESVQMQPLTTLQKLKGDLLHYSYNNIAQHAQKINNFTTLMAADDFQKGKKSSITHILIKPLFKFFTDYIIKRGFLDGLAGFQICILSSYSSFLRQSKLLEMIIVEKESKKRST